MERKLLLKAISGSVAYNLATQDSDVDYRGIYLDPPESIFGLEKSETSSSVGDTDDVSYSFKHFMKLLVNCNPNIVELLYIDRSLISVLDPRFKKFIMDNRDLFLSKRGLKAYYGYITSQLNLVEKDNRPRYSHRGMDCKAAMHIIRLIQQATHIVTNKTLEIKKSEDEKEHLLSIRDGKVFGNYDDFYLSVQNYIDHLQRKEDESDLRDEVDMAWVNGLMKRFFEACYYETLDVYR